MALDEIVIDRGGEHAMQNAICFRDCRFSDARVDALRAPCSYPLRVYLIESQISQERPYMQSYNVAEICLSP